MSDLIQNHWGDIASVLGLLIGIVGFIWTIRVATKAKDAAESVRKQISKVDAASALAQAKAIMEESKRLNRNGAWEVVLDRCARARELVIVAREYPIEWQDEHLTELASAIGQLQQLEKRIETSRSRGTVDSLRLDSLNGILARTIDGLSKVEAQLRSIT